jgi:hypothetical protein
MKKFWQKKGEVKSLTKQNEELEEQYKLELNKARLENVKNGEDYKNLPINKNLVHVSEAEKNKAEQKKAESQTQSKFVNGVQVGCTVVGTVATVALWHKDQKEGNATRTEVGKVIANYGKTIIGFFKKK